MRGISLLSPEVHPGRQCDGGLSGCGGGAGGVGDGASLWGEAAPPRRSELVGALRWQVTFANRSGWKEHTVRTTNVEETRLVSQLAS